MKCIGFYEHENGDLTVHVKTSNEKEDQFIWESWDQHPGCEARKRFNDADPVWVIRVLAPELKMRAKLTFQES
jgi:hypothetical protein